MSIINDDNNISDDNHLLDIIDIDIDIDLFNKLSDCIKKYIFLENDSYFIPEKKNNINVCCDNEQIFILIPILKLIILNNPKPTSYTDVYYNTIIYFLILYLFYSLVLGEQTHDLVNSKIILKSIQVFWGNYVESIGIFKIVEKLYLDICTNDEKPYHSKVRRLFFGMTIEKNDK
jgi:hypothetical protein